MGATVLHHVQEHQPSVLDAAASRHYFDDLATQNEAAASTFEGDVPAGQHQPGTMEPHQHTTQQCLIGWCATLGLESDDGAHGCRWRAVPSFAPWFVHGTRRGRAAGVQGPADGGCIQQRAGEVGCCGNSVDASNRCTKLAVQNPVRQASAWQQHPKVAVSFQSTQSSALSRCWWR